MISKYYQVSRRCELRQAGEFCRTPRKFSVQYRSLSYFEIKDSPLVSMYFDADIPRHTAKRLNLHVARHRHPLTTARTSPIAV